MAAEGNILCEHPRIIERGHHLPSRTIYDWRHYLAVVQRKPGALRNGAPFLELPPAFRQLQDQILRKPGGDREMVRISQKRDSRSAKSRTAVSLIPGQQDGVGSRLPD